MWSSMQKIETLKGYMDTEKRRTVIDALKSRLEGLQGAAE